MVTHRHRWWVMTDPRGSADLKREQAAHDRAVWEQGFRAGVRADQAANLGDHAAYLAASRCPYREEP